MDAQEKVQMLKDLRDAFSTIGYSVFIEGDILSVSKPSKSVSVKECKSLIKEKLGAGYTKKAAMEQVSGARFSYVKIHITQ